MSPDTALGEPLRRQRDGERHWIQGDGRIEAGVRTAPAQCPWTLSPQMLGPSQHARRSNKDRRTLPVFRNHRGGRGGTIVRGRWDPMIPNAAKDWSRFQSRIRPTRLRFITSSPARSDLGSAAGEANCLKAVGGRYVSAHEEINPREQRGRRGGLGYVGGVERLQVLRIRRTWCGDRPPWRCFFLV
jgi:hypothetical protein